MLAKIGRVDPKRYRFWTEFGWTQHGLDAGEDSTRVRLTSADSGVTSTEFGAMSANCEWSFAEAGASELSNASGDERGVELTRGATPGPAARSTEAADVDGAMRMFSSLGPEEIGIYEAGVALRWLGFEMSLQAELQAFHEVDVCMRGRLTAQEFRKLVRKLKAKEVPHGSSDRSYP